MSKRKLHNNKPKSSIVVRFKKKPPKDWWTYHTKDCGTKYRGCSPDCPKNIYEETGEWRG